ncbi:MAG: hypothetical protein J5803_03325, partial [Desulfovibrio sp.]|nr:hypothetical protein [Desulfovibrio sp.]
MSTPSSFQNQSSFKNLTHSDEKEKHPFQSGSLFSKPQTSSAAQSSPFQSAGSTEKRTSLFTPKTGTEQAKPFSTPSSQTSSSFGSTATQARPFAAQTCRPATSFGQNQGTFGQRPQTSFARPSTTTQTAPRPSFRPTSATQTHAVSSSFHKDMTITDEEFLLIRDFIYQKCGIFIAENRK